jgi:hypothetical protein
MSGAALDCQVSGEEIIITLPGSDWIAVYRHVKSEPRLQTQGVPRGTTEFKVHAWELANDKARELGWMR